MLFHVISCYTYVVVTYRRMRVMNVWAADHIVHASQMIHVQMQDVTIKLYSTVK